MTVRAQVGVLLWAQRILNRRDATAAALLEVKPNATLEEVQSAFHDVARTAHPDMHRTTLNADELELVTRAYSRVAGAYQELRTQKLPTTRMEPIRDEPGPSRPTGGINAGAMKPLAAPGEVKPSAEMTSKALVYYRKAEMELRRGDLKMAVLQLKLAIAADPQSAFLRSALAEVQAAVDK